MADSGKVPPGKITAFDRGQYDNLTNWVDGVDQDLTKNINKPKAGVRIDATLGSGIFPGSSGWTPAANLIANAKAFGQSWVEQSGALSKDWEQFVPALRAARDVFENTNDLANYSATAFLNDFPDVAGPGTGGPSAPPASAPPASPPPASPPASG
ncbi:MAG TPA: hypothetical protein VMU51_07690 [Mycobacteriales bacterium]|nr:hypothetical protein [Mycobacteriales bacterium]